MYYHHQSPIRLFFIIWSDSIRSQGFGPETGRQDHLEGSFLVVLGLQGGVPVPLELVDLVQQHRHGRHLETGIKIYFLS